MSLVDIPSKRVTHFPAFPCNAFLPLRCKSTARQYRVRFVSLDDFCLTNCGIIRIGLWQNNKIVNCRGRARCHDLAFETEPGTHGIRLAKQRGGNAIVGIPSQTLAEMKMKDGNQPMYKDAARERMNGTIVGRSIRSRGATEV